MAIVSKKLEAKYPGHLILLQAGTFLHGFDRTAYTLNVLKKYKMKLIGATDDPHIRIGFPTGNFKKRLWSIMDEFQIPYVVSLGNQASGYQVYVSSQCDSKSSVLSSVTDQIVQQVINDLRQTGELNTAATKQLLTNPNSSGFKLKEQAQDLDTQLLHDIIKMPRNLRATYGENLRACSARIMRSTFAYGSAVNKPLVLQEISADVDLMKYYLTQAPRLSNLKSGFESRVRLAVELGKLVGGLTRSKGAQS